MKTEEEIKELAEKRYGTDMNSYGGQRDGFKEGYKQCQQEQLNLHLVIEIDTELIEMINKCDQTAEGLRADGFEVTAISSEAMAQAYRIVRDMINCSR